MPSSGYSAWSVVAGQQPTASYWNILGSNDASFNTGNGFNDGIIATRHYAASSITPPAIADRTRWVYMSKSTDNTGGVSLVNQQANEIQFTGTPTAYARVECIIPQDYVAGTTASISLILYSASTNNQAIIYYLASDGVGTNMGSLWNLANNITTGTTINLSANIMATFSVVTIASTNLAAGDIIALAFRPSAAITGSILIPDVYLAYTADS